MPLSHAACRDAKATDRAYKLRDGEGMYLFVTPSGGRLWRMDYRFQGKQKTLSFGKFPAVGLAAAREKRTAAHKLLAGGYDPALVKNLDADFEVETFEGVARDWLRKNSNTWTEGHRVRIVARLEDDAFPVIGATPVGLVKSTEILAMLRKIEERGAIETAKRVLQYVRAIYRYAIATGTVTANPADSLSDALMPAPRVRHHAALKATQVQEFLEKLYAYDGERQTALAIELVMHTFPRTSEIIKAERCEFEHLDDPKRATWRIPAERMKMRREHIIPLTPAAVRLVKALFAIAGESPYLLPSSRGGTISQNTLLFACYRLGFHSRVTIHGMRSLASTVLNEHGFNSDWIERQLAHVPGDEVRAAYNAAEWLAERREMMTWWSSFLEQRAEMARLLS